MTESEARLPRSLARPQACGSLATACPIFSVLFLWLRPQHGLTRASGDKCGLSVSRECVCVRVSVLGLTLAQIIAPPLPQGTEASCSECGKRVTSLTHTHTHNLNTQSDQDPDERQAGQAVNVRQNSCSLCSPCPLSTCPDPLTPQADRSRDTDSNERRIGSVVANRMPFIELQGM